MKGLTCSDKNQHLYKEIQTLQERTIEHVFQSCLTFHARDPCAQQTARSLKVTQDTRRGKSQLKNPILLYVCCHCNRSGIFACKHQQKVEIF